MARSSGVDIDLEYTQALGVVDSKSAKGKLARAIHKISNAISEITQTHPDLVDQIVITDDRQRTHPVNFDDITLYPIDDDDDITISSAQPRAELERLAEDIVIPEQTIIVVPIGSHRSILSLLSEQGAAGRDEGIRLNIDYAREFAARLHDKREVWDNTGIPDAQKYLSPREEFNSRDLMNLAGKYGVPYFFFKDRGHYLLPMRFPPVYKRNGWYMPVLDSFSGEIKEHKFQSLELPRSATPIELLDGLADLPTDDEKLAMNPIAADYLRSTLERGEVYDLTDLSDYRPDNALLNAIKQGATQSDLINCGGYALWYQMVHWAALVRKDPQFHDTFLEPGVRAYMPLGLNITTTGRQRLWQDTGIYIASQEELQEALRGSIVSVS